MSERLSNEAAVERALDELRRADVRDGEVFLRESHSTTVEVVDGQLDNNETRIERGVGVRVLDGQRVGFSYTSDLTAPGIAECVELARATAKLTEPDDALAIASEPTPPADGLAIHDPTFGERDIQTKLEAVFTVENSARLTDRRIKTFRKTSYGDAEIVTILATTRGALGTYRETSFGSGTSCMAVHYDDKQIGGFADAARTFVALDPYFIGQEAAERAVEKLGAREFETGKIDILLDPYMAIELLGAVSPLFSAENVLKGKSLLAGKIGQRVASERVTIRDEGRRPGGQRTVPFDGEGTPTRDVVLVEKGVLRGYLHSIRTANKMGAARTGSARRGGYAGTPHPGPSNLVIAPGTKSLDDIIDSTERLLDITSLLNLHTVDPISGDFSLGATAQYMEAGVPLYPVKGITIAGNLVDLLNSIAEVGDDIRYGASGFGSPTLLVRGVSVGGT